MPYIMLFFAAAFAVIVHLKLKRTWVKFLVGAIGGFFGSMVLGLVIGLILESNGNPQLGKDVALAGFKNSLGASIAIIVFLFIVPLVVKRKQLKPNETAPYQESTINNLKSTISTRARGSNVHGECGMEIKSRRNKINTQSVNYESFKKCPFCAELIKVGAVKCRFCREMIDSELFDSKREESDIENGEGLNNISNIVNPIDEIRKKNEPDILKGVLCIDNYCTGFTDKEGYCDKCGKNSSGKLKNSKIKIGNLSFCSENNCIGKIGNDGRCTKCGK